MLQSAVDTVAQWSPDLIIYAGDREEVWMGATIGAYLEIPTVHFYGGDQINTGHVDNAIRHATSKLSTYHVVPIEEHRSRLMAIGEPASRISVIGSMALDNFVAQKPFTRDELKDRIGLPSAMGDYALVLFHPEPSERETAAEVCRGMLREIKAAGLGACVGYPNIDPSNKEIIASFEEFKEEKRFYFYKNLDRTDFISLYKGASMIIGNSSSGIVEAASIPIPAISVGARQRGRHAGFNVLAADTDRAAIRQAIEKSRDPVFLERVHRMINPYGDGKSTERAYELLVNTDFEALRLKTEDPLAINGQLQ
jgi:UDP-N-acetylglucosamine 2-epimerase (non-hydrolysing)/GDP/UDP-N,N'-diacetylbacillosamine 2-epimerase (hydrolysing)